MDGQILLEIINSLSSLVKDSNPITLAVLVSSLAILHKSNSTCGYVRKLITSCVDKKKQFSREFSTIIDINDKVLTKLKHLKNDVNADRVYIVQYHNGLANLSGLSFAKMSCTHEVVKTGLKVAQPDLQNLPVSAFSSLTNAAFGNENTYFYDIEKLKRFDVSTYSLLKSHKAKSVLVVPLKDDEGSVFGFVVVEFTRLRDDFSSDELKCVLCGYVDKISALLDRGDETKELKDDERD